MDGSLIPIQKKNQNALSKLFIANSISGFAQGVTLLAIPWYYAAQNLSAFFSKGYALITFLSLFFGLYAGTLVDKYNRKKIFIITSLTQGISLCSSYFVLVAHPDSLLIPILIYGLTIFGFNIHYPNLYAFCQELSPKDKYPSLSSSIEMVGQVTSMVSGALAACFLQTPHSQQIIPLPLPQLALHEIFLLDGITYFIASAMISSLKFEVFHIRTTSNENVFNQIKEGFQFLNKHRKTFLLGLFPYMIFACSLLQLHSLMPRYILEHLHLDGSALGISELNYALGALLAGISIRKLSIKIEMLSLIQILMILAGISYLISSMHNAYVIFLFTCICFGYTNAGTRVLRISYLFEHVPNQLLGRVNSVYNMLNICVRTSLLICLANIAFKTDVYGSMMVIPYMIFAMFLCLCTLGFWMARMTE